MNLISSRKNYGVLKLSRAALQGMQLEWSLIENSPAYSRHLNFPFVDRTAKSERKPRVIPREKRALAA